MRLLCVPPEDAKRAWSLAAPYVNAAMARAGLSDVAGVYDDVLHGRSLLWLATDDQNVVGAGVTRLITGQGSAKVCLILAWGCDYHANCAPLLATIEDFARAEDCTTVRIEGRKGWRRRLPGWVEKAVIMEKVL